MFRQINRLNYIFISLVLLPVFLHAQTKLKNNSFNTFLKPLSIGRSLPALYFFLSGFKNNGIKIDTAKEVYKKTELTDIIASESPKELRSLDLYTRIAQNNESNYPSFHDYYFKLPYFTGVIAENTAILNWQTTINENVRLFLIERSTDRKNFSKVGEIDLAGKANTKNFSFKDSSISNSLLYYYQVKVLLIDGSSLVSDFIPVKNSMVELKASLTPGINQDILKLKINQPVRKIEVINTDGQVIYRRKNVNQEDTINICDYLPGSYALKIFGYNGYVTQLFFTKENNNK